MDQIEAAGVGFCDAAGNGKAKPGTSGIFAATGTGVIGAVEAFENAIAVFRGDAEAVVQDIDLKLTVSASGLDLDLRIWGGILDGVIEEDHDGLAEAGEIAIAR